eukprot:Platyproteum_vivax@DN12493_c0_g1_i1.p1
MSESMEPIPLELSVQNSMFLKYPDDTFDTVVDTFGICSYELPVETLNELSRVCKPDGRVLLLEHGASTWWLVNASMATHRVKHAWKFGCYYNRNILDIVDESNLEVLTVKRGVLGEINVDFH